MAWVVITVLLLIALAVGVLVFIFGNTDTRLITVAAAVVGVVVWAVITVAISYNRVGQLQVGLVYNFTGTLQKSVGHGSTWLSPWQHLVTENIGLQKEEFTLDSSNSAVSQDQQSIFGDIQLNYEVEPQDVVQLYKTVGPSWKVILLEGRMLQDFKQVTSTYSAAEITTHRAQLRADTRLSMQKELAPYGIKVVDVLLKNLSYSKAYEDAITQKTIQVQRSKQAEAKVLQAKAEADQAIATARGKAASNLLVAQAAAKALDVKGAAIRRNPDVLKLEAIDKLNPNASVIICTGNCPSFLPSAASDATAGAKK